MLQVCQRGLTEAQNEQVFICSLAYTPHNWQAQILHNTNPVHGCKNWSLPIVGRVLICCGVQAIFYHKFFIPNHPPHQSGIFLMESFLEMNATKMKENGWMIGVLWGFEPFSHENHHIRVYMHHVCLIQSISARKVTHIKLGTCSGSSQCQLHFGTKMVSIGWSGCDGCLLNAKMRIFRHFLW